MLSRGLLTIVGVAAIALIVTGTTYGLIQAGLIFKVAPSSRKPAVLATFYPQYDFAQNIGGDRISLSLLVPMTVDVHEFEPTPSSIQAVANARVLIYNGAGLEPWIPQVVSSAGNDHLLLVDASRGIQLLDVSPEFQREGRAVDPHVWLDPILAKRQVDNILQALISTDPTDEPYFTANAQAYNAKLDSLNSLILNDTRNAMTKQFVTFHEAFGYFAKEYGLTQIPISGPFEEEPTPSDILNVVNVINQNHFCVVGYESLENPAIAQSIASQTHARLMRIDPIEGLSPSDQALGKTYLVKMQEDVKAIGFALQNADC